MILLSVPEAATCLNVTPARVRQMLADGLIEGTRVGHQWVIEAHAVQTAAARKRPSHRPWSP